MKRFGWMFGCATAVALTMLIAGGANAQRSKKKLPYEVRLWNYLNESKYRNGVRSPVSRTMPMKAKVHTARI